VTVIEDDLHWQALHDLDVVAGGVFGRQQAERRSAAGLDAVDPARKVAAAEGVNPDIDGLPDAHGGKLCFLEVGGDPHIQRHHDHDRLPGSRERADRRGQLGHASVDGGVQRGALQVRIGTILLCAGLIDLGQSADLLRVEHIDLAFRLDLGRGGRFQRGPLAVEVGGCLLRALHRAGTLLH
jgi:hypothetical protein